MHKVQIQRTNLSSSMLSTVQRFCGRWICVMPFWKSNKSYCYPSKKKKNQGNLIARPINSLAIFLFFFLNKVAKAHNINSIDAELSSSTSGERKTSIHK